VRCMRWCGKVPNVIRSWVSIHQFKITQRVYQYQFRIRDTNIYINGVVNDFKRMNNIS
jgi:hypothetical protein